MTNITEIISQKAKEEFPYSQPLEDFISVNERQFQRRQGFKIGASVAISDPSVLKELLGKFAEWLRMRGGEHKMSLCDHDWYFNSDEDGDFPISDEELAKQFIDHINSKADESIGVGKI